MLFYGSPGTGKTSAILAIANQMYGKNATNGMVMELNASDDRGISVVREKIIIFSKSKGLFCNDHKLVILDEADSMTKDAQNSLRRIIEKYTMNVRFCFICNYQTKIIPAIQSRCMKFRFAPLPRDQMMDRLEMILKTEGAKYEKSGIEAAISLGSGDMRKTVNILESSHLSFGDVNDENVYQSCGQPTPKNIEAILEILLNQNISEAFKNVMELKNEFGLALNDIISLVSEKIVNHDFSAMKVAILIKDLADIEYRLDQGSSEKCQVAGVVSAFHKFRVC